MRKVVWAILVAGAVGVGGAAAVGCSGNSGPQTSSSSRPAAAQLSEGVNVLSARPDWGMDAAYKKNGRVIYFQTRVGALKPELYRNEFPNQPQYEMDARFVDEKGHTFKMIIGGDNLIDSSWPADIVKGREFKDLATSAERQLDFQLASDIADELMKAPPKGMDDHVYHLVSLGHHNPYAMPMMIQHAADAQAKLVASGRQVELGLNGCSSNFQEGDLYGQCIFACVGHHSSVIGWNYNGCNATWDEEIISCNHGACAADSGMNYQGYTNSAYQSWDLNQQWSAEMSTVNRGYTSGHGCQTNYNWNTPPGHLCNDDSSYELWNIHDGPSYGYGSNHLGNGSSFCYTNGGHGNACSCSSSCNNCSGDWSFPDIPAPAQ
jgi:hypothetical protein